MKITTETLNLSADKFFDDVDELRDLISQSEVSFDDPRDFILMVDSAEELLRKANQTFIEMHNLKKGLLA